MIKLWIPLLLVLHFSIASTALSKGKNDQRLQFYDVRHYDLSIEFDVLKKSFKGVIGVTAVAGKPLSQLVLSASNETLTIDSVVSKEGKLTFRHEANHLIIQMNRIVQPNDQTEFTVHYKGLAKFQGQYDAGGVYIAVVNGLGRITTTSEPDYARTWWPCKDMPDDKATISIDVTVPSTLVAVSNGSLINTIRRRETTTYQWETKYPTATYLVNITAGKYRQWSDNYVGIDGKRMKVYYYVFPEDLAKAKVDFENTTSIIGFFARRFGEYPFIDEKFGYIEVTGNLTMENQTICTIEDRLITGDRQYELTFVHEIAHHWWGNLITLANWQHTWLNEGFATYAEALYIEETRGRAAYHKHMNSLMSVRTGYYAGSVIGRSDTSFWDSFSHRVYNKGAIVLHMLRGVMGDEQFFTAMKSYIENPALRYANARTEDFIAECELAYGKSLKWFFDQWVYAYTETIDRPEYEFSWIDPPAGTTGSIELTIEQKTASRLLYTMPMTVHVNTGSEIHKFDIVDSLATQVFRLPVPGRAQWVELDRDNWIFKTVTKKDRF